MSRRKKFQRPINNAWGNRIPDQEERPNPIVRTGERRYVFAQDHMPPKGKHRRGRMMTFDGRWPGTQKENQPSRRKRRNRTTWQKNLRNARRYELALKRARKLVAEADA